MDWDVAKDPVSTMTAATIATAAMASHEERMGRTIPLAVIEPV